MDKIVGVPVSNNYLAIGILRDQFTELRKTGIIPFDQHDRMHRRVDFDCNPSRPLSGYLFWFCHF
ncbi:hypothetical protein X747_03580 [Mesorhizobium sp. LNJC384A00]|nr:hypothetical protein X766_21170 [Mesorhizobium sp. LSJC255A00]ESX32905.1 hypothetical protein X765_05180 [Mesorhizobium sp. LSHC440B00]ESX40027.1 hypothetical protein X763_03250 [Mesorhizobium sp. LSHC432A00]ESX44917.1 hypothetical protein X764_02255 [Mesorhizobium sp. LSHC440A00]ESX79958.1 hypothetical protein X757_02050 [Mesorhizobium sp. LSHC414A00]ESY27726.1 hypothetical protein X749_21140 [Mesorhizobium sp. LNJC391B00]ESY44694.1 hypothetical protein X747_03580 [Mesorhizobium sp. LNJC3